MYYDKVVEYIVNWLKDFLNSTGLDGFVVGLSGGVDSSVTAALCLKATPNVLAVIMPCYSSENNIEDARLVASKLGLNTIEVNLNSVYDSFLDVVGVKRKVSDITLANIKPRLRMVTLYYFANKYNYAVAGTGNKTELTLGYFTKYGDGAADLLPLGDLLKRDVRKLAEILQIPRRIIDKPPSADLWPGQTDEGELGAPYDILDKFVANEPLEGVSQKTLLSLSERVKKNAHKLKPPKICKIPVEIRETKSADTG
ncbi:MAG: NAD(+) synthase [Candidatus Odinarchaeia archaeon]